MLPAHERRVLKLAAPALAVWVDVINGEIIPRQLAVAFGM
jgi:hypothetical protein